MQSAFPFPRSIAIVGCMLLAPLAVALSLWRGHDPVEHAATLPLIFQLMSEHPDITVQQAEKFVPPFDDVFVKLMEQAEEEYV